MITHLHAPMHMSENLERNLETILRLKPDVVNITEQDAGGHDNVNEIRQKVGHKYHVCAGEKHGGTHSRENVILIRKKTGRRIEDIHNQRLSDKIMPPAGAVNPGIGNDRWMLTVFWRGPFVGRVASMGTHWNAVIQDPHNGSVLPTARADVMRRASNYLEKHLQRMQQIERRVTGGADFNWRGNLPRSNDWNYGPARVFKRNSMKWYSRGLDWVWWWGFTLFQREVIPAGEQGNHSDHPWILITLKKA